MSGVVIDVGVDTGKSNKELQSINANLRQIANTASASGSSIKSAFAGNNSVYRLNKGVNDSTKAFRELGSVAPKALQDTNTQAKNASGSLTSLANAAKFAVGAFVALGSSVAALSSMDSLTNLQNKLRLVTKESAELLRTQTQLISVTSNARASFKGTVDTYFSLARAMKVLGANQDDLLAVTGTIQKSIAVSGTTAESAAAALFQLSQGLASGTLRGEELNSVMEQIPRLGQVLTESLGMNAGSLRKFAEAGELTSQVVFNAIKGSSELIAREFDATVATFQQGITAVGDSFMYMVGSLNQSLGVTQALYGVLKGAANAMFAFGDSIGTSISEVSKQLSNYYIQIANFSKLDHIISYFSQGGLSFFDLNNLLAEISAVKVMYEYFNKLSSITIFDSLGKSLSSLVHSINISLMDLARLATGVAYAFTSLFHTFGYMVPDIRGPVQEITSVVSNSFLKMIVSVDAAASSIMRPIQRMINSLSEGISYFLFWDTRVQRAWVNLANSAGLQDLIANIYKLGDALQTRNLSNFWIILKDKVTFLRGIKEDMREILIFFNLIDNRFLFINNIRFDRLLFALNTIKLVVTSLYTDILYPKFGPAIAALYTNIKGYVDALSDAILDAVKSIDPAELGAELADFLKGGFNYLKDLGSLVGSLDLFDSSFLAKSLAGLSKFFIALGRALVSFGKSFFGNLRGDDFLGGFLKTLDSFFLSINPSIFGKSIRTAFTNAINFATKSVSLDSMFNTLSFDSITDFLTNGFSKAFKVVGKSLDDLFDGDSLLKSVGKTMDTLIKELESINFEEAGRRFGKFLLAIVESVVKAASNVLNSFASELGKSSTTQIGAKIAQLVQLSFRSIADFIKGAAQELKLDTIFERMINSIVAKSSEPLSKALVPLANFGKSVIEIFYHVWDVIVGHSYWPDTINGIISWSKKIKEAEAPINSFTKSTTNSFKGILDGFNVNKLTSSFSAVTAGLSSSFEADWYNTAVKIGSMITTVLASKIASGSNLFNSLLIDQGLSGFNLLMEKFGSNFDKLAQFGSDVLGKVASTYVGSFIETIDSAISAVPKVLSSTLDDFGVIGGAFGSIIDELPDVLTTGLVVAFGKSLSDWSQSLPDQIANTIGVPIRAGLREMVRMMAPQDSLVYNLVFGSKVHPGYLAAGALALVASVFDSVSAVQATLVGIPLIYTLLLGDKGTRKFTTEFTTKVLPQMFGGIIDAVNKQMDKINIVGALSAKLKEARIRMQGDLGQVGPQLPSRSSALVETGKAYLEQLKSVFDNVKRNLSSYNKGNLSIWETMFRGDDGKIMRAKYLQSFAEFKVQLKQSATALWGSLGGSEAGKRFQAAYGYFKDFAVETISLMRKLGVGLKDIFVAIGISATRSFSALKEWIVSIFSNMSARVRTVVSGMLTTFAIMASVFSSSANAATGVGGAVTDLTSSFFGLAAATLVTVNVLKLFKAAARMRELTQEGVGFTTAMRQAFDETFRTGALSNFFNFLKKSFQDLISADFWSTLVDRAKKLGSAFLNLGETANKVGQQIIKAFKAIIDSGILGNLLKAFNELFWGLIAGAGNIPNALKKIALGLKDASFAAIDLLKRVLSVRGALLSLVVVGGSLVSVGFLGDASFSVNVERLIDDIAFLVGFLDKPAGTGLQRSVENTFSKLHDAGGRENSIQASIDKVDFSDLSARQISQLNAVSKQTATTLKAMNKLYEEHGSLTSEQSKKVEEAIKREISALEALPQKAAKLDFDKVTTNLQKSLQVNDSWYLGFKNLVKAFINSWDDDNIVLAGSNAAVKLYNGLVQGLSSYADSFTGYWGEVFSSISVGLDQHLFAPIASASDTIASPFIKAKNKIGGFFDWMAASYNNLKVNLGNIAFPDTGAKYLEQIKKDISDLKDVKLYLDTSEWNQAAKYFKEFDDAYKARYDGTAKTAQEEKVLTNQLDLSWRNLRKSVDETKALGAEREQLLSKASWDDEFFKKIARLQSADQNLFQKATVGVLNFLGQLSGIGNFSEWAEKRSLLPDKFFNEDQIRQMQGYTEEIEKIKEKLITTNDLSAKGVELRVRAVGVQRVQKELETLFDDSKFFDKKIDIAITTSNAEITKEQLISIYSEATDAANSWMNKGLEIANAQIRLKNAIAENNRKGITDTIAEIENLRKQAEQEFEVNIKPKLKVNYFEEFNKDLQAAGLQNITAEIFLKISNNKEINSQIEELKSKIKSTKKEMDQSVGDAWTNKFREWLSLTGQLRNALSGISQTLGSTASFFGARIEQVAALDSSKLSKLQNLELNISTGRERLNDPSVAWGTGNARQEFAKAIEAQNKEVEAAKKQFETKSAETGKGMAKSLTDAFSEYIKRSGFKDIDIVDYSKMTADARKQVDALLKESTSVNKRLQKTRVGDKPTEQQMADLLKIQELNKKANKVMEESNRTIEDMVSTFGQVYDGFTIASWFELPASTLADIKALWQELYDIQQLMKEKPSEEMMQTLAARFKAFQDRKFELGVSNANYGVRKEQSGLGLNYDRISSESAAALDKLQGELKILMNKQTTATGDLGREYYQEIKNKQREIDTATAAAIANMPVDQTKLELSQIGISVGEELYKATDAQLASLRQLKQTIYEASKVMQETDNEQVRQAAYKIVTDTKEQLQNQLAKISKDPVKEAGKEFASSISNDFTTGLSSILKSDKTTKEAVGEFTDQFTSQVLDTFTKGIMEPLTGDGGMIQGYLKNLGEGIFGTGGILGGIFGDLFKPSETIEMQQVALLTQIAANTAATAMAGGIDNTAGKVAEKASEPGMFTKIYDQIVSVFDNVWKYLVDFGKGVFDFFKGIDIAKMMSAIGEAMNQAFDWVASAVKAIFKLIMSMFADGGYIQGFAGGGKISGPGSGRSDSILARASSGQLLRVSNGEYIVNAKATALNRGVLDAINFGGAKLNALPGYADGGAITFGSSALSEAIKNRDAQMQLSNNTSVTNNISITGDISRQTRQEIQRMIPQITAGVNSTNTENNYRR